MATFYTLLLKAEVFIPTTIPKSQKLMQVIIEFFTTNLANLIFFNVLLTFKYK